MEILASCRPAARWAPPFYRARKSFSDASRTRGNERIIRANEARTELSKAILRARSANESHWDTSRSEVVERYEAYAKALEDARAAAVEAGVQLPDATAAATTGTAPQ
jgi:hypothetical protein